VTLKLPKQPRNRFGQSGKPESLDRYCETEVNDGLPVFREKLDHELDLAPSRFGKRRTSRPQHPASFLCAQGIPDMSHIVVAGGGKE
jgi:hypothetical protein